MATRFYLPSSTAAPYTPPNVSATWDVTTAFTSRATDVTKSDSAVATITTSKDSTTSNHNRLQRVYVSSQQLAAQTIAAGTFSAVIRAVESTATADFWLQIIIRVMSSDGSTQRGVLYAGDASTTESATVGAVNEEYPTTAASRIKNAIATSSVVAQAGDRIHIEIGARGNGTTTGHTFTHTYGDLIANSDFTLTSGTTTTGLMPWVELSVNLTWQQPVTGSGALTATAATLSGAGTLAVTGTGAPAATAATASGAGTLTVTGAGALTAAQATLGGAGTLALTGAGSPAATPATLTGAGTLTLAGTGALAGQAALLSGAGALTVVGAGALTAAPAELTATGDVTVPLPPLTGPVTGAFTTTGTGTAAYVDDGSGTAAFAADGTGTAAFTTDGTGVASFV